MKRINSIEIGGGCTCWRSFSSLLINYSLPAPVWAKGGFSRSVLNNWYDYGYLKLNGHVVMNAWGNESVGRAPVRHEAYTGLGYASAPLAAPDDRRFAGGRTRLSHSSYPGTGSVDLVFPGKNTSSSCCGRCILFLARLYSRGSRLERGARCRSVWHPASDVLSQGAGVEQAEQHSMVGVWLVLVACYVQIEWATVFAIFILWSTVVAIWWRTKRRRVILFTLFLAVTVLLCLTAKVLAKVTSQGESSGSLCRDSLRYLSTQTVGSIGYDGKTPMSWGLALRRLISVDLVGLLPLWLMFAWVIVRSRRGNGRGTLLNLTPLLASVLSVLVMRNTFVPHKWMQMPIIGMGILFSMHLFLGATARAAESQESKLSAPGSVRIPALLVFALGGFLYCLVILTVFKVNDAEEDALVAVVSENTPRSALVVIGPNLGPYLAADPRPAGYAMGLLDRKTVEAQAPVRQMAEVADAKDAYFVDSEPLPELGVPLATSEAARIEWIEKLLGWYRHNIAQWTAKTRPTLPSKYYLYRIAAQRALSENTQKQLSKVN
jgi:hypothetical protein